MGWTGVCESEEDRENKHPIDYTDEYDVYYPIVCRLGLDLNDIHVLGIPQPYLILLAAVASQRSSPDELSSLRQLINDRSKRYHVFHIRGRCQQDLRPYIDGKRTYRDTAADRNLNLILYNEYIGEYLKEVTNPDNFNEYDGSRRHRQEAQFERYAAAGLI